MLSESGATCTNSHARTLRSVRIAILARGRDGEGEERKRREAAYTLPTRCKVLVPIWRSMMDYTAVRVKNLHPRNKLSGCYCLLRRSVSPPLPSPPLRSGASPIGRAGFADRDASKLRSAKIAVIVDEKSADRYRASRLALEGRPTASRIL